jgi:hypothetical protein
MKIKHWIEDSRYLCNRTFMPSTDRMAMRFEDVTCEKCILKITGEKTKKVCSTCKHLIKSLGQPMGQRFNDEYRCEVYQFLFWHTFNTKGMSDIGCKRWVRK